MAKKYVVFSGEFTSTSATLNNARLSFHSALEGAQTIGSSLVTIDTTNYPSESVLQLQNLDTVLINDTEYTVATTIDNASDNTFNLTAGLDTSDVADNLGVYASQSATLTIRLTTVSALSAGSFRILVPAVSATSTSHDGYPDSGGFEFGNTDGTPASIACPVTASYGTFTATSTNAEIASVTLGGVNYHSFVCDYDGAGAVGTIFDGGGSNEEAFVISNLINPAPKTVSSNHTLGQADTYSVIIQQRDSLDAVIDQTTTKIGVIDAVKVSASVAPQITFTIEGLNSNTPVCDINTDVTTTPLSIPFSELTIAKIITTSSKIPKAISKSPPISIIIKIQQIMLYIITLIWKFSECLAFSVMNLAFLSFLYTKYKTSGPIIQVNRPSKCASIPSTLSLVSFFLAILKNTSYPMHWRSLFLNIFFFM